MTVIICPHCGALIGNILDREVSARDMPFLQCKVHIRRKVGCWKPPSRIGGEKEKMEKEEGGKEEEFISTPEYDAEILRDERIIEKVRREREKEGIKEEENL